MPGPSNLYGVANPVILPVTGSNYTGLASPANVETTLLSTAALVSPSPGYFYPMVWISAYITFTATPPGATVIAFKIGAGSDVDSYTVPGPFFYANQSMEWSCTLVGVPSNSAWVSPGSIINITSNPAGQPVTIYNIKYVVALFRAPDQ